MIYIIFARENKKNYPKEKIWKKYKNKIDKKNWLIDILKKGFWNQKQVLRNLHAFYKMKSLIKNCLL